MLEVGMPERPLVFLSYSRSDFNKADQLRNDIINAGIEIWWDQNILAGQDWKYEIREAIRRCNAVILCLSNECLSRRKSGIYPEALDAIAAYREYRPGEIYLIPVRFSECFIPCIEIDGSRTLDRLQYVDLFPPEQWHKQLKRVIESIEVTFSRREMPDTCHNNTNRQPTNVDSYDIENFPDERSRDRTTTNVSEIEIEILIYRDFDDYTEADKEHLLCAIAELLKMKEGEIRIKRKQRGSVRLTLGLPPDKAEELLWAIKTGQFEEYGVVDAELKEPPEITKAFIPRKIKALIFERNAEETNQLIEGLKRLADAITTNSSLISDIFKLPGTPPSLYCGGHHPQYAQYDLGRMSYEELIPGWAFSLLSTNRQAYLGGTPKSDSAIIATASPMANKYLCYAQGLDPFDLHRRRIRPSLTGEPLLIDFEGFYNQGAESSTSYISGESIDEFRWGIIDNKGRVVAQPDIYRENDAHQEKDISFVKNDDLLITVLVRRSAAPIIFTYGAHAPGSMAMTLVLSNARLLREIQRHRPAESFQAHVHIPRVVPDHERRLMTIPDSEHMLVLVNIVPVIRPDERLSQCFVDSSPQQLVDSDILSKRALLAAGANIMDF